MAKKILFVSHTANFAKFNRPFMKDLRKAGYTVHYASAGEESVSDVDQHFTIPFERSPFDVHNMSALTQLRKLLKREKYDLVHCHTPVGGVLARLAVLSLPKVERPKVIYTSHGFHFYQGAPVVNWLLFYPVERCLARVTDTLVTINSEDFERAKRKFRAGETVKIDGVGVDLKRFRPVTSAEKQALRREHGLKDDDFVLIYVAELNKNKDPGYIIDSLAELRKAIPELKFLMVGVGPLENSLKESVEKQGLTEVVEFTGYRRDIDKLYQMSDIAVSASHREGLGLGLIEAMACGLPIVARNNRGHRDIIVSSKVGAMFKTDAEFREAILKLYNNPKERVKIGKHNVEMAKKYSLDKARATMARIYNKYLK